MSEIAGRLILNWNSKLRKDSPVAKYFNVNTNLSCTENYWGSHHCGLLGHSRCNYFRQPTNVATSILVKLRYDAVSSANSSRTIVANAPPFTSSSQPRSVRPFFLLFLLFLLPQGDNNHKYTHITCNIDSGHFATKMLLTSRDQSHPQYPRSRPI